MRSLGWCGEIFKGSAGIRRECLKFLSNNVVTHVLKDFQFSILPSSTTDTEYLHKSKYYHDKVAVSRYERERRCISCSWKREFEFSCWLEVQDLHHLSLSLSSWWWTTRILSSFENFHGWRDSILKSYSSSFTMNWIDVHNECENSSKLHHRLSNENCMLKASKTHFSCGRGGTRRTQKDEYLLLLRT